MTGKAKVRQGNGERVGEAKAEQEGDGDDLFVDAIAAVRGGPTVGIAIARRPLLQS